MNERVAVIGVGWAGYRSITPEISYKELMYEAAVKAYDDAGVDPRKDVDSFITVSMNMSPINLAQCLNPCIQSGEMACTVSQLR